MRPLGTLITVVAVYVVLAAAPVSGLRFFLGAHERACFGITARAGSLLHGVANMENGRGHALLAVEISTANGVIFERHAEVIGKFSVHTPRTKHSYQADPGDWEMEDGDFEAAADADTKYTACLVLTVKDGAGGGAPVRRAVTFRLYPADTGENETRLSPSSEKASKAKVDEVAGALETMLTEMERMAEDLDSLRRRERSLVRRQRKDAKRLSYLGATSILVLVGTALLQFKHFTWYFTSKKLC